ncbi:hypothetical protein [Kitasatospora sp. GP82]|uniref:hypothetical protein n=1 Tax=Kitasatospora sp. GP82 TaxID=3035089 RepID=UPI0024759CEE|nr:hypothetical protein [Kitasatospora sp. GP82]MDH6125015.1 hypothetical protein [Kitasatospora sp. GP82]
MTDNGSATLSAGAVTFITANENRDHDTGINISVATPDGVEVASISVPFGEFKDGTTARRSPRPWRPRLLYALNCLCP